MAGWDYSRCSDVLAYTLNMKAFIFVFFTIFFLGSAFAQSAEQGANEIQVWTSGGHSVAGGRGNTGLWNVGLRYGWVLTKPIGPGFLKGRFEYAIDAVPVYLIFQPVNTAYGAGLNPVNLKWNFATRGHAVPYLELSGGTLFTSHEVPSGTSTVNFTSSAAFGVHFLGDRHALAIEARYLHISNAGLTTPNPGVNTVEVRLGIGRFKKGQ
jgi:lipid A 3-O-deacylase